MYSDQYTCICMCICTCTCICMCICICICMFIYLYMYMYVFLFVYVCVGVDDMQYICMIYVTHTICYGMCLCISWGLDPWELETTRSMEDVAALFAEAWWDRKTQGFSCFWSGASCSLFDSNNWIKWWWDLIWCYVISYYFCIISYHIIQYHIILF
jgi:hypothetical protein